MIESPSPAISQDRQAAARPDSLWQFSLRIYREPEVAEACVALQDEHGVDVNLLLCLLWLAAAGHRVSAAQVAALDRAVADWRQAAVIPLRTLRRGLKGSASLRDPGAVEAFRTRVKALELEAERLQQEELQAVASSLPVGTGAASPSTAADGNVAAYQSVLGRSFERGRIAALLAAMPAEPRTR